MTLRILTPAEVPAARTRPIDEKTLAETAAIVSDVRDNGEASLRRWASRLDNRAADAPLLLDRSVLENALAEVPVEQRRLLERTAARIRRFADAQRLCLLPLQVNIECGRAGHDIVPVERAGCYAPGGRYPLPSSVLMTAVTARAAGVSEVIVATPNPGPLMLAAAAVARADAVVPLGGAQAIAALAFGAGPIPACDVIVGPGNRWVTAAKQFVSGTVGIDMLAGPSELAVLADDTADPALAAADLLAQAEHDPDALPILISLSERLSGQVNEELERQLRTLPTADIARAALQNGFAADVLSVEEACALSDRLAPEHLVLAVADPERYRRRLRHYGALFLGSRSAEVFGDYGAGPNHVLPTGGTARFSGGLSVLAFLRVRTWLQMNDAAMKSDAAALARLEGLEAHARAAERR